MPCSANARTEGVQSDLNQHLGLPSSCDPLVYGSKNDPSCKEITAVTTLEGMIMVFLSILMNW